MPATFYAIINCLFKLFTKVQLYFYQFEKWLYVFVIMNKDLLMLCIAFYSGLEILLIQSSTSQICVFVDPWKLQTSPNIYCCNNTAAKSDWFAAVLQQRVFVLQVAKVFLKQHGTTCIFCLTLAFQYIALQLQEKWY